MEAGRPGWYDALNGLPGLFGSSMPETTVVHHNPQRRDLMRDLANKLTLETQDGQTVELAGGAISAPCAAMVRTGQVKSIHIHYEAQA